MKLFLICAIIWPSYELNNTLLFYHGHDLGIKYSTKVNMQLNKKPIHIFS